jgi:hypothetical protein
MTPPQFRRWSIQSFVSPGTVLSRPTTDALVEVILKCAVWPEAHKRLEREALSEIVEFALPPLFGFQAFLDKFEKPAAESGSSTCFQ